MPITWGPAGSSYANVNINDLDAGQRAIYDKAYGGGATQTGTGSITGEAIHTAQRGTPVVPKPTLKPAPKPPSPSPTNTPRPPTLPARPVVPPVTPPSIPPSAPPPVAPVAPPPTLPKGGGGMVGGPPPTVPDTPPVSPSLAGLQGAMGGDAIGGTSQLLRQDLGIRNPPPRAPLAGLQSLKAY